MPASPLTRELGRRNCLSCSEIAIKLMLICRKVARKEEKMSKTVNRAVVVSITSRRRRFDPLC